MKCLQRKLLDRTISQRRTTHLDLGDHLLGDILVALARLLLALLIERLELGAEVVLDLLQILAFNLGEEACIIVLVGALVKGTLVSRLIVEFGVGRGLLVVLSAVGLHWWRARGPLHVALVGAQRDGRCQRR